MCSICSVSDLNPVADQKVGNIRTGQATEHEARKLFIFHASTVLVNLRGSRVTVQIIPINLSRTIKCLPRSVPIVSNGEILVYLKSLREGQHTCWTQVWQIVSGFPVV